MRVAILSGDGSAACLAPMSGLTRTEKTKLERLFEMGGGYVLDFSNPKFADFLADSVGLNLWEEKYNRASGQGEPTTGDLGEGIECEGREAGGRSICYRK